MCMHAKRFVRVICPWCRGGEVGADIYQTIHNLRSNGKNPIGVKSSTHNAGFLLNAYSPRSQTWSARTQTKVLSAPWSLYVTAVLRGPFLRFSISRTLTSASYGPMEEPARSTTSLATQRQAPRVLSPSPTDQTRASAAHPPPASVPRAPARLVRVWGRGRVRVRVRVRVRARVRARVRVSVTETCTASPPLVNGGETQTRPSSLKYEPGTCGRAARARLGAGLGLGSPARASAWGRGLALGLGVGLRFAGRRAGWEA